VVAGILTIGFSLVLPNYDDLIKEKLDEISWQQAEKVNCPNDQCQKALDSTIKTLDGIKSDYDNLKNAKNIIFAVGIVLVVIPAIPKISEYIMAIF